MSFPILTHSIRYEQDVVIARQRARQIAAAMGFDGQDQTRIATAVSEIARNAFRYTGGGKVQFIFDDRSLPQAFIVEITDEGKGIPNLETVLSGRYQSETGMGLGIIGTKRLMDDFYISTSPKGTLVRFRKNMSSKASLVTSREIQQLTDTIMRQIPRDPLSEIQQQNQELLRVLEELKARQEELQHLNQELEDTNRGVVALYAELDEKADHLRRADELKTKFLSNMSHEFRTPLNSMLALTRILLDRTDGELSSEQEIQINFIRKAATDLSELVNDLLDLAKVEAGKIVIHPTEFQLSDLFGALRGMLRPLFLSESVKLVFEDVHHIPTLYTDEGKVSQILRNLISNALKFTEKGEVRISAELTDDDKYVLFKVCDTGMGIAMEHQESIFQEFTQLDSPTQRSVKGTGLGLPLSRKLAELLGGWLMVESTLGLGSTFIAKVARNYGHVSPRETNEFIPILKSDEIPVVVVEDRPEDVLIYEKYLADTPFRVIPAYSIKEARAAIIRTNPKAIILDIFLKGEEGWSLLSELKLNRSIVSPPVMVITTVEDRGRAMALGADAFLSKPVDPSSLLEHLNSFSKYQERKVALIIDDEEVSRYLMRQILADQEFSIIEAPNGGDGIKLAVQHKPSVIFLDLIMPGLSGFEVARRLKSIPDTKNIPIIISTSKVLSKEERNDLAQQASDILSKEIQTREDALSRVKEALERAGIES